MIFMRVDWYRPLYKLLGITPIDGYNQSIVREHKNEEITSLTYLGEIHCFGVNDWDILEKRVFNHYKVKVLFKVCLIVF